MSYDRNLFLGWYAEFTPSKEKIQVGVKTERECSSVKGHKHGGGAFCSKCGSPVVSVKKPVMKGMSAACHIIGEDMDCIDQEDLTDMTCGRASLEDLKILKGSIATFPLYSGVGKEYVFASGHIYRSDIGRDDGFTMDIPTQLPPSEKWKETIVKIFGCTDLVVKFGMIVEVR
jgi:hypothetical protein